MKTAEQKLRSEYEAKIACARTEDAIRAALPTPPKYVHVAGQALYGTTASVKYEGITLAEAAELVAALPAVSLTLVKDSCTSIRPTSYVESLPEEKKAHWKEEAPISSLYVEIEGFQGPTMSLHWVANIAGVGLVRLETVIGYPTIGQYRAQRREYVGGYSYDNATFTPAADLHTVMNDGEAVAQLESPIRWASGGPSYPQRFTLYFVDLGVDMDPAFVAASIAKHLVGIK